MSFNIKDKNKLLTHKGYAIRKSFLNEKQVELIQKQCTVEPITDDRFGVKKESKFKIYLESPERYYLPREWAINHFGQADENLLSEGCDLSDEASKFVGKPYDYQTDIINMYLNSPRNGLICVPCGKGKTFMALNIASQIKKRFLIIVDKEFLMNQWKNEIKNLMPNIRIGILQGDTCQVGTEVIDSPEPSINELKEFLKESKLKVSGTRSELIERLNKADIKFKKPHTSVTYEVTICMIQTLCLRDFNINFFRDYGFTIFDECHHLGAQYFSKTLQKVQTRKMLGLSATPKREDGLTKVFEMFLGKPIYWEKVRDPDPTVQVKAVHITCQDPNYLKVPYDYKNDIIIARLITYIVECKERNQEIVRWIHEICANKNRKLLILSARIEHLRVLDSMVNSEITRGYYIGGMKEEERETGAANSQLLLASYSMASEAMNIKALNAVILASPRSNVEQSTGRILRVRISERVVEPLIIDIIDPHEPTRSQWKRRLVYYNKCKYNIQNVKQGGQVLDTQEDEDEDKNEEKLDGCLIGDD
jgi:superfamily II DNA or RNA helicase